MPQAIGTTVFVDYFMPQAIGTTIFVDYFVPQAIKRDPPPRKPKRRQGHQNEFRSTLEDKLLEKIVLIWTPAKTMKKTPQTSQEKEATKRPPPGMPKRAQGRQNEFWSTLEDKLLEKIIIIWTPAKTWKMIPQTLATKCNNSL